MRRTPPPRLLVRADFGNSLTIFLVVQNELNGRIGKIVALLATAC
jgi:hypothetical protein